LLCLCILLSLLLSGCGTALPESEDKTPLPNTGTEMPSPEIPTDLTDGNPIDIPTADPVKVEKELDALLLNYYDGFHTDRPQNDYLSAALVAKFREEICLDEPVSRQTVLDMFGSPHYIFNYLSYYSCRYTYILDDGNLFEIMFGQWGTIAKMYHSDLNSYVDRMQNYWKETPIIPEDPKAVYDAIHLEFRTHMYTHFSDRTDFADMENAKKINFLPMIVDIQDLTALLGEPHFMYSEEKIAPGDNSGRREIRVYVLDNGAVLYTFELADISKVSIIHINNLETCMEFLKQRMYY